VPLDNYEVFTRPNQWLQPKHARSYYDIFDKRTGQKHRVQPTDLWNTPQRLKDVVGEDAENISAEIVRREKELEALKDEYLSLYETVKQRYDAGMKIPRSWMNKLEDMFDQMYQKDTSLGQFSGENEDTIESMNQKRKMQMVKPVNSQMKGRYYPRSPTTEAPHVTHMPEANKLLVDEDDYYPGRELQMSTIKLARACDFLINLEKNESLSAGPTETRAVGYVDPGEDKPLFAQPGEPANTQTEGYRNKLYSKKKVKNFMKAHGFVGNIENLTNVNENFRKVIYTGKHSQLVLMKLLPGEEIGSEVHENIDQFFRVDSGEGIVVIDGKKYKMVDGSGIIVPAGSEHNVINSSKDRDLKLYTIYSPPEHKDQVVRATKHDAETQKEEFDGKTTE
jgi:mannose-6-phosphate isomerase-like protein (cupin superfamily)